MQERHDRLRIAFKRTGLTQAQACERHGWNRNTLKSNLNGNAQFGFPAAKDYARAFGVRAEWLYDGMEPMLPTRTSKKEPTTIPLISWVAAGGMTDHHTIDPATELEHLTVSGLPPGDYFATRVKGDSMDRVSPDGATIIVNRNDRDLVRGKPYLFSHRGETTFKIYEPLPVPRLEPLSTNPMNKAIFLTHEEWAVVGRVYRSILDL